MANKKRIPNQELRNADDRYPLARIRPGNGEYPEGSRTRSRRPLGLAAASQVVDHGGAGDARRHSAELDSDDVPAGRTRHGAGWEAAAAPGPGEVAAGTAVAIR